MASAAKAPKAPPVAVLAEFSFDLVQQDLIEHVQGIYVKAGCPEKCVGITKILDLYDNDEVNLALDLTEKYDVLDVAGRKSFLQCASSLQCLKTKKKEEDAADAERERELSNAMQNSATIDDGVIEESVLAPNPANAPVPAPALIAPPPRRASVMNGATAATTASGGAPPPPARRASTTPAALSNPGPISASPGASTAPTGTCPVRTTASQ